MLLESSHGAAAFLIQTVALTLIPLEKANCSKGEDCCKNTRTHDAVGVSFKEKVIKEHILTAERVFIRKSIQKTHSETLIKIKYSSFISSTSRLGYKNVKRVEGTHITLVSSPLCTLIPN